MENEFSACVSDGNRLPRDKSQPEPPRREIRTRRSGRTQPADWGEGGLTRSRGCTAGFTLANRFNDNLIIREERPLVHSKSSFFRHCARLRVLLSNKILLGGKKKKLARAEPILPRFHCWRRNAVFLDAKRNPLTTSDKSSGTAECLWTTHTHSVRGQLFIPSIPLKGKCGSR